MLLRRYFASKQNGFFVDVGSHHPVKFSNTYLFYKEGWRGINIDAMPGSMRLFNKIRPKDVNVECPVSDQNERLTYYAFSEPALNGFSKEISEDRCSSDKYSLLYKEEMQTVTLNEILARYLPVNQDIDFISIDVEGLDFKVLKSLDLAKYKPELLLIEVLTDGDAGIEANDITLYLIERGYRFYAKTVNTVFYKRVE